MKLCNETITVFNAFYDEEQWFDLYKPTVIRGVSWYCEIASTVDATGLKAANKFTIRIPTDAYFSDKTYVTPLEYASGDPDSVFTLKQGDIIIQGRETASLTPAQLKEKYGEIVTILGVTDNRRCPNAKHWKVVGA